MSCQVRLNRKASKTASQEHYPKADSRQPSYDSGNPRASVRGLDSLQHKTENLGVSAKSFFSLHDFEFPPRFVSWLIEELRTTNSPYISLSYVILS
jgi:hypothetical protein